MNPRSQPLVIKSFAKVNLYLRILNRRKDNFHNLDTLFARIGLADTIILKSRKDNLIKIKCASPHISKGPTNICFAAADLLRQRFKIHSGLDIEIRKRIPVGAGLGGGSSDAASVILGLNKYWHLNLSKTKLADFAAKLGSDVAFFIHDVRFALGSGRGDRIKPLTGLKNRKLWFVLVYPGIKVSTPLIYKEFDSGISRLTRTAPDVKIILPELLKNSRSFDSKCFVNDLEAVTSSLYPVVGRVKKALLAIGLKKVSMSGSGAAVFALLRNRAAGQGLINKLRKKHGSWQFFLTSTV